MRMLCWKLIFISWNCIFLAHGSLSLTYLSQLKSFKQIYKDIQYLYISLALTRLTIIVSFLKAWKRERFQKMFYYNDLKMDSFSLITDFVYVVFYTALNFEVW